MTEVSVSPLTDTQISKNRANLYHLIQMKCNRPAYFWYNITIASPDGGISMEAACRGPEYQFVYDLINLNTLDLSSL